MKRKSIKFRLTLWFTAILTVICVVVLLLIIGVYRAVGVRDTKNLLTDTVIKYADKISTHKSISDAFQRDTENKDVKSIDFIQHNVQLNVYHEDGSRSLGIFKFDELDGAAYNPSSAATEIILDGERYYYFDFWVDIPHESDLWVRGIIPAEESLRDIFFSHKYLLLLLPLLTVLAFFGGYFLTGSFIRPIAEINATADEIRKSGDLAKRIELPDTGDELSELSQKFNSMFESLEQNFEVQKQFTSNASHELRTPVSVILAQCEYALDNKPDRDELFEVIRAVQKQGFKMSHMIETLLIFSRIENHSDKYITANAELTELISSICGERNIISEKNIKIDFEYGEKITYPINKELFELMVNNLIGNAVRYGKENGFVKVKLKQEGSEIILSVSDDGAGISEEDMPHIWERFYRSDKSRSTKGLGLGLSLVKQIAEYHGGTVKAESEEGKGSTFWIFFHK
ncbi:MAG: HAMP domain-containing histidine kinase [Eubacterium sp.]|nr:HAMP domain-containing histidine kinase [Eubacterium sp.]